jgi:RNA 2',3'-cyclic 3'-phosphodiesterase
VAEPSSGGLLGRATLAADAVSVGPILRRMAVPEPTLRLFLALWPDEAVRAALRARRDAIAWPAGARPTATERLHLTLHFLGNVPAARRPAMEAALAMPCTGFVLRLTQQRAWPGGLVVLQASDPMPPPLVTLHGSLGAALRDQAWPVETRAFRPHVTLARHCHPSPPLADVEPLPWSVEGYALVQSTPSGYHLLRRYRCT